MVNRSVCTRANCVVKPVTILLENLSDEFTSYFIELIAKLLVMSSRAKKQSELHVLYEPSKNGA